MKNLISVRLMFLVVCLSPGCNSTPGEQSKPATIKVAVKDISRVYQGFIKGNHTTTPLNISFTIPVEDNAEFGLSTADPGHIGLDMVYTPEGPTIEINPEMISFFSYNRYCLNGKQEISISAELLKFENTRMQDPVLCTDDLMKVLLIMQDCKKAETPGRLTFGDTKVCLYDLETKELKDLGIDGKVHRISLAPDKNQFTFTATRNGKMKLFVYDLKRGTEKQLTDFGKWVQHPAWSPDGKWIAFYTSDKEGCYMSVIHPDGSGFSRLKKSEGNGWGTRWSPDGQVIVFPYKGKDYQIRPDGTDFKEYKENGKKG